MRAVLIGCGGRASGWVTSLPPGTEIVGFVDTNLEAAKRLAERSNAIVDDDLTAVLRSTRPDVVFDCTPPDVHPTVTMTALAAGCHVLGEKPMAASMDDARRMVSAAQRAKRIYAVSQNRRYGPGVRELRQMLPQLGTLTSVHSDFFVGAHFGGFRERMDHPLLLDMAIHTFDLARALTGADAVAVYCEEWNPKDSWYEGPSSAVCVFEMTGGLVFTYRGSWSAEGEHTGWLGDWRIIGEGGSVTWDGGFTPRGQLVTGRNRGDLCSTFRPVPIRGNGEGEPDDVAGVISEFVESVDRGRVPQTVCTDNIKSLAMVFAAIESARTNTRVAVGGLIGKPQRRRRRDRGRARSYVRGR